MVDHTPPCAYLLFVCIDIHASHWLTWPTYFSYSFIASRIVAPLRTVDEVETDLQPIISPASLPHQLRILFPAADNRTKQIAEHVRGARNANNSNHNNNHNPSHTHRHEHRSGSVLALFASVIMRPPHRLNIYEQPPRSPSSCRPTEVHGHYTIRCGGTYISPTAKLLPIQFMSFLLPVPYLPVRL